ncbi:MAG: hypothetical protein ABSD32_13010, partial [Mycobacterium sp.]
MRTLVQQTPETRADTLGGCALMTAGLCRIARLAASPLAGTPTCGRSGPLAKVWVAALQPLDYPV